ncbi:MAG TPA: hypothetical protein VFG23_07505 [Polyangia bacterium]|nr:hypothetical protein [Polyangia bacterium]
MNDFLLELDGPDVRPASVDSAKLLGFASAYLDLLVRMAGDEEAPISFHGLNIIDKCVAIQVVPDDIDYARVLAGASAPYLSGDRAPRGLGANVARVQESLRAFPKDFKAKVIVGPWVQDLFIPETKPTSDLPTAVETMRANIQRVGGADPRVRFKGLLDRYPFSIDISHAEAIALAPYLYKDVEIVVRVTRTVDGRVSFCELEGFEPISDQDSGAAWRAWFKPHAKYWDDVKDISEALGRRDQS